MREIRTSGLMSGEGKRSDATTMAQATAPFLDSTPPPGLLPRLLAESARVSNFLRPGEINPQRTFYSVRFV
jgi:hypothetical protein